MGPSINDIYTGGVEICQFCGHVYGFPDMGERALKKTSFIDGQIASRIQCNLSSMMTLSRTLFRILIKVGGS